ncbi:MAG: glycoside hydrolase family 30 protein [bacterium]
MSIKHIVSTETHRWRTTPVSPSATGPVNLALTGARHQTVLGFGGCFNELGFTAIRSLPVNKQALIFKELFGENGCRFNVCRLPIGANDYAEQWYSLNDTDGDYQMRHFSIERDRKYLIPYIRMAQKAGTSLTLFASPWSPPAWMKFPKAYNYGTLVWDKKTLSAYALYFLKFVQAYEKENIPITQLHIQNEPMSSQKFPSCVWTGEQFREFIGSYLGPLFKKHGIQTEIWLGTLNGPEIDHRMFKTRFNQYANHVLSDPKAGPYVKGVGYQWAGKYALQQTQAAYPDLPLMQTESECGDGTNTWAYAEYIFEMMWHYFTNGVTAYVYWNMVLAPGGESTWGWKQNSMITVDPDRKTVQLNPEFYLMKHFSSAVLPGATRLGLTGPWAANAVAFQNPDDSKVLVVTNPFKEARRMTMDFGNARLSALLEPSSFNTFIQR